MHLLKWNLYAFILELQRDFQILANSIHSAAQKILDVQFDMTPCIYLLNAQQDFVLDPDREYLFRTITYFAKKCIILLWASNTSPTLKCGLTRLLTFFLLKSSLMTSTRDSPSLIDSGLHYSTIFQTGQSEWGAQGNEQMHFV